MYILTVATQWAIVFSGIFLWIGMLTGVWKYYQIRHTERARAHYYILPIIVVYCM
ncbi:putative integral membrane protein [Acinetobacter junii CIP 107470 = MTCC 11364]|uniref:Putative integral membrane protein n=1 Tax=Acinetobacter junii CIP 107470 = MTCC 11364 TaxID=1217666 RepID=S7YE10_ACIJU|nr:putative integral membrane protein [Acinetobacter junii CIP 107470 = MTCC 11364]